MKQFFLIFLRWLLVNMIFVVITIISAGFHALSHFALAIPAAGFIYLLLFGFLHSKKKNIIIGSPLITALVAVILQFFPLQNDTTLWFFVYPSVGILLALILSSRFIDKPLAKEDALLLIAMVAVFNGTIYLIFEGDFFWSLRLITIFGYSSAVVFLAMIFSLKPVASGIKWLFGYTKSTTPNSSPSANSTN